MAQGVIDFDNMLEVFQIVEEKGIEVFYAHAGTAVELEKQDMNSFNLKIVHECIDN